MHFNKESAKALGTARELCSISCFTQESSCVITNKKNRLLKKGSSMSHKNEEFRIGKLAKQLGVQRFVIRFWEKEFGIASSRTKGGQRFYKQQDFEQFKLIKQLLYERQFTIAGAKKILQEHKDKIDTPLLKQSSKSAPQKKSSQEIFNKIAQLQKRLIKLRELL